MLQKQKEQRLLFTLRVDAPVGSHKPLYEESNDEFRFTIDFNPDSDVQDFIHTDLKSTLASEAMSLIVEYLKRIEDRLLHHGLEMNKSASASQFPQHIPYEIYNPRRIAKVNYVRNSPLLANVYLTGGVNGDVQPPKR